ncbi:hypothetical protein QFC19_004929, partial [Naganishia cerealis]
MAWHRSQITVCPVKHLPAPREHRPAPTSLANPWTVRTHPPPRDIREAVLAGLALTVLAWPSPAPVQETTGTPPADGEKSTLERADAGTGVVHPPPQPGKRGSTATPRQPSRAGTDATTAATAAAAGPSTVIK